MRGRRGASALEFALTAPVLLLAGAAVLDLAWFIDQQAVIAEIAGDATRAAVRGASDPDLAAAAAEANGTAWLVAMGLPCADGCAVDATAVTVAGWPAVRLDVAVPVTPLTGFLVPAWTARASATLLLDDPVLPAQEPPAG